MFPYSANPSTVLMLASSYREERIADATHRHLARAAKAQARAERRSSGTPDTVVTRHWFARRPGRRTATSGALSSPAS
jgi:hypothetical protein